MTKNVGTIDRILRVLVGAALIAYGIVNHTWLGALGLVPLLTATLRFCPAYCPLGISTAGASDKSGQGGCGTGCGCGANKTE